MILLRSRANQGRRYKKSRPTRTREKRLTLLVIIGITMAGSDSSTQSYDIGIIQVLEEEPT